MHKKFLLEALVQAQLGRGICAPNPSVGAVAVQNGKIIAMSYHKGAGTAHAEQLVLQQIPKNSKYVTLYVTLEPCNHWGKTPPCVDAIIDHNISEVVYGFSDPNILVKERNTPKLLMEKNILVTYLPLPEIAAFYQSYHYWMENQKPWITVKMAQSLDGKIAGEAGQTMQLSNSLCSKFTHQQRAITDIILTSAKTINQDDPQLNVRINDTISAKPLAIIDRNLQLNKNAKVLELADYLIIFHGKHLTSPINTNKIKYIPIEINNNYLDLNEIIKHLGSLGYHDVWVEAGGEIFTALHTFQLVNCTYLYIVPTFLGENATFAYNSLMQNLPRPKKVGWQAMEDNMIICLEW